MLKASSDWTQLPGQFVDNLIPGTTIFNFPYNPGFSQVLNDPNFKYHWSKGFMINVTNTINGWVKGEPNNGFIFHGGHESLTGGDDDFCHSWLGPLTLTVDKEYPSVNQ